MVSLPPAMVEKAEQSSSRGRPLRFLTGFVLDFIVCLLVARLFKITASSEEYKSVMKFQANFYAALDDLGPWHIIQIYWNILSATFSQIWANWQNFAVYGRVFTAIGFVVFLPFIILGIFTETILALSADSDYLVKWLLPFLLVIVSWMVITIWSEQNEDRTVSLLDVIGIAFFMLFLPVTIAFVATFVIRYATVLGIFQVAWRRFGTAVLCCRGYSAQHRMGNGQIYGAYAHGSAPKAGQTGLARLTERRRRQPNT
jgi:hypothetical protein